LHVRILLINGKMNLKEKEREIFLRKRALTSKGEKNIKKNIITSQVPKSINSPLKLLII